jgi:hypothetical protein
MKIALNTVQFALTGIAEMVWDIGTKIAAVYVLSSLGSESICLVDTSNEKYDRGKNRNTLEYQFPSSGATAFLRSAQGVYFSSER